MSPSVLFAWELGDGLGHVTRLLRIAEWLSRAGVSCRFAVRNVELAGAAVQAAGFELLQSPLAKVERIRGPDGPQPVTAGDILAAVGFASESRLSPIVGAWDGLLHATAPDLVVTDYAPTANLALFGGNVPWVVVGDGFTLPPHDTERFLPFRRARPAFEEEQLLAVVARVQARRHRPVPGRLPQLFEGSARFVVTLPELDPWLKARKVPPIGPVDPPPRPVDTVPTDAYFAYLSASYEPTFRVLEGLLASGAKGSVFLRDATQAQREEWRQRGLLVWDSPRPLRDAAQNAAVIVHHGGVGTAEQALGLGRPQLLVPRHFEQTANATSLGGLGVAVALRSGGQFTAEHVGQALALAMRPGEMQARARVRAEALAARSSDAAGLVGRACLDLLEAERSVSSGTAKPD